MAGRAQQSGSAGRAGLPAMSVAALGMVFGDIGTSPLYVFKAVLDVTGSRPDGATTLGVLSLIVWTLVVVTTLKYVGLAMTADNEGEGGILALMSLLVGRARTIIVFLGLFGAALIYGDGAITPAISVLSALEGTSVAAPALRQYVLPAAVVILLALFAIQHRGTHRLARWFGPVMLLWFVVIAVLGIGGIARHPAALAALDPMFGLHYLAAGGSGALLVVGGVFLSITGAEALYADMGHFGKRPIRFAWSVLVFPALVLNYAGQAAIVLAGEPIEGGTFFRLCPPALQFPLVLLATLATVIASQAIITGAFSMTRQAVQLGWLPPLRIVQTSAAGYGQIYVPSVNWLLMTATLALVVGFGNSGNLAAAYGIAVSATMLITTVLLFTAMRDLWRWPLPAAVAVAGAFAAVDGGFLAANLAKVAQGGWVPLLMGAVIFTLMLVWHAGAMALEETIRRVEVPASEILDRVVDGRIARVHGTAVFLTRSDATVPPILLWHLAANRALHKDVFILDVSTASVPYVPLEGRVAVTKIFPRVWRARARFGFMERPDVPAMLQRAQAMGYAFDPDDVTYYVAFEQIVPSENTEAMPRPAEAIFAFLHRNSAPLTDYFRVPHDKVVAIGRDFPM